MKKPGLLAVKRSTRSAIACDRTAVGSKEDKEMLKFTDEQLLGCGLVGRDT
jgi:hypothetical protein